MESASEHTASAARNSSCISRRASAAKILRCAAPVVANQTCTDSTQATIEPDVHWQPGSFRLPTNSSEPTANSATRSLAISFHTTTTVRTTMLDEPGAIGSIQERTYRVDHDTKRDGGRYLLLFMTARSDGSMSTLPLQRPADRSMSPWHPLRCCAPHSPSQVRTTLCDRSSPHSGCRPWPHTHGVLVHLDWHDRPTAKDIFAVAHCLRPCFSSAVRHRVSRMSRVPCKKLRWRMSHIPHARTTPL